MAVGEAGAIHRSIDRQGGQSVLDNHEMMDLVKDLDDANCWAVGRFDALVNQAKLPEGIMNQIPSVRWFSASGHINGGLRGAIRAEARDEQAAQNLRDVVQGFLALARMQTGAKPELQALVELSPALRRRQDREPPLRGAGQGPRHGHEREEKRGIDFPPRASSTKTTDTWVAGFQGLKNPLSPRIQVSFSSAIYQNPPILVLAFFYGTLMSGYESPAAARPRGSHRPPWPWLE